MPLSSFLGLVIFSAETVLYPHYLTLERSWGPTPLDDQRLAGGVMWVGGDAAFVLALVLVVAAWLRHEERANLREDARLARQRPLPTSAGPRRLAHGMRSTPNPRRRRRANPPE